MCDHMSGTHGGHEEAPALERIAISAGFDVPGLKHSLAFHLDETALDAVVFVLDQLI